MESTDLLQTPMKQVIKGASEPPSAERPEATPLTTVTYASLDSSNNMMSRVRQMIALKIIFDGKGDWDDFLTNFELQATLHELDAKHRLLALRASLAGEARELVASVPDEKMIETLRDYFGQTKREFMRQFFAIQQEANESFSDYWNRAAKLFRRTGIQDTDQFLTNMVRGLRSRTLRHEAGALVDYELAKGEDIKQIRKLLLIKVNSLNTMAASVNSISNRVDTEQVEEEVPTNSDINAVRYGRSFASKQQKQQPPRSFGDRRDPICFRCGRKGHLAKNCRQDYCIRCQKQGHMADVCRATEPAPQRGAATTASSRNSRFPNPRKGNNRVSAIDGELQYDDQLEDIGSGKE
jgi:hypothetical protein